jgi:hypothetical protein
VLVSVVPIGIEYLRARAAKRIHRHHEHQG